MPVPVYKAASKEEISGILDGSSFSGKKYDMNVAYGYSKSIAALYVSALARKHSDFFFCTMSPGATSGTDIAATAPVFTILYSQVHAENDVESNGSRHDAHNRCRNSSLHVRLPR
jgi:hypothetical protein